MPVSPPEITTFRPAVEGLGEDAIESAPGVHGAVQQVVDVQHVEVVQHDVVVGQHVLVGYGQHGVASPAAPLFAFVGTGQHIGTTFGCARFSGQMMRGTLLWETLPAAPAGLSTATTHSEAARMRSDDGKMKRRIAETGVQLPPDL